MNRSKKIVKFTNHLNYEVYWEPLYSKVSTIGVDK